MSTLQVTSSNKSGFPNISPVTWPGLKTRKGCQRDPRCARTSWYQRLTYLGFTKVSEWFRRRFEDVRPKIFEVESKQTKTSEDDPKTCQTLRTKLIWRLWKIGLHLENTYWLWNFIPVVFGHFLYRLVLYKAFKREVNIIMWWNTLSRFYVISWKTVDDEWMLNISLFLPGIRLG